MIFRRKCSFPLLAFWLTVVISSSKCALAQRNGNRNRNGDGIASVCSKYGAVHRAGLCVYPALADCRRKPSDSSQAALFRCPTDTTCEPITGLCVCQGEYKNTGDTDNILTCVPGQNYGQPCSEGSSPCLARFECTAGKCACPTGAGGHFNQTEGECISDTYCKAKHADAFYEAESKKCKCLLESVECMNLPVTQNLECPIRSNKQFSGGWRQQHLRCECNSGMTMSSSKRVCLPSREYGAECAAGEADACDSGKHLTCGMGGKCECVGGRAWHASAGQCRLRAGQACAAGQYGLRLYGQCVEYADCIPHGFGDSRSCYCDDGFQQTGEGRCVGRYRTSCSARETCDPSLDCIEGACDCRDQISTVYERRKCRGIVGSHCNSNGTTASADTSTCVENAECHPTRGVCECKPGFRLDPDTRGLCMAAFGHGEACTKSSCDFDRGYTCKSGKCACADSFMTYRGPQQGCLAPVGFVCGSQKIRGVVYKVGCDGGAECRRISEDTETQRSICVAK